MKQGSEEFDRQFVTGVAEWLKRHHQRSVQHIRSSSEDYEPVAPPPSAVSDDVKADPVAATALAMFYPWSEGFHWALFHTLENVESPIEKYMLLALVLIAFERAASITSVRKFQVNRYRSHMRHEFRRSGVLCDLDFVCIDPQSTIADYRVDFLVTCKKVVYASHTGDEARKAKAKVVTERQDGSWMEEREIEARVVVECEGHEWHEKTKEQAQRDKRRLRDLQSWGYRVYPFTGRDIWQDTIACAETVYDFLREELQRQEETLE